MLYLISIISLSNYTPQAWIRIVLFSCFIREVTTLLSGHKWIISACQQDLIPTRCLLMLNIFVVVCFSFFLMQMLPDILRTEESTVKIGREISQALPVFPSYHCYAGEVAVRLHSVPKPEGGTLSKPSAKYPTRDWCIEQSRALQDYDTLKTQKAWETLHCHQN